MKWYVAELDAGIIGAYPTKAEAVASIYCRDVRRVEAGYYEYYDPCETRINTYHVFTRVQGLRHGWDWALQKWEED